MSTVNKVINKIYYFIICFYVFFYYLLPDIAQDIIIVSIPIYVFFYSTKKRIINLSCISWLPYIIISTITLIWSVYKLDSLKVIIVIFCIFSFSLLHIEDTKIKTYITNICSLFSLINIITVILNAIFEERFTNCISKIYTYNELKFVQLLDSLHMYSGLSTQVGDASFFSAIIIMICFAYIINNCKNKVYPYICVYFGIIAMLLANQRGPILSLVLSLFIILIIDKETMIREKNNFIVLLILLIISICVFPKLQNIFLRFASGSLSSRDVIYADAIKISQTSNIIRKINGIGIGSFIPIHEGVSCHNEYLRSFVETGIIGTITFVFAFFNKTAYYLKNVKVKNVLKNSGMILNLYIVIISCIQNTVSEKYIFLIYIIFSSLYESKNIKMQNIV